MSHLLPPDKLTILGLPVHAGVALRDIKVPKYAAELEAAWLDLSSQRYIGFDTESKPRFIKGEALAGPDLVQFATATTAYLFQLHDKGAVEVVRKLLSATSVIKVGFDLRQDQTQLMGAVNASARPILDLDVVFRSKGFGRSLGIKNAVAVVFSRRFIKSKHTTTSNWSSRQLDSKQLVYAANDAFVALQVFNALLASGLNERKLPVWVASLRQGPWVAASLGQATRPALASRRQSTGA